MRLIVTLESDATATSYLGQSSPEDIALSL